MYYKINQYMAVRGNLPKNEQIEGFITGIKDFMGSSALNQDFYVYRGIKSKDLFNALMGGMKELDIIFFQSTSLSREVSSKYAGNIEGESILMRIRISKGTHGVDVSKISAAPTPEDEILLDSSGKYSFGELYYNRVSKQLEIEAIYER